MPIPNLNEDGLLPEGIHDCTLEEIGAQFGRFVVSERRVRLFTQLGELVAEEQRAGIAVAVMVDGSFVTDKPEPGDIDLVIVLPADYTRGAELPPFQYNAMSKAHMRRRYRFDVLIARQNSVEYVEALYLFQHTREGFEKGILRIKL
ncbi:MAG: hypothetical protein HOP19_03295 [Acidobacteria bacterium]|nr:hypothetical protein [Acidobacteriota bacterium]